VPGLNRVMCEGTEHAARGRAKKRPRRTYPVGRPAGGLAAGAAAEYSSGEEDLMRARGRYWMLALVLISGAGCASQAVSQARSAPSAGQESVMVWDCGWRVLAQP